MMAALEVTAVVPAPPNPDEDAWLYGDTQPKPNGSTLDANATEFISQAQNGQNSEEDSDSDDDDVQITIRDITKAAPGPYGIPYQPPQISALPATKTVSVIGQTAPTIVGPITTTKRTIDVNAVGSINGVPIYDYDIETMCEDRPWRIPGADMTDYFNYGFNETSWKSYCDKQRNVRVIAGEGKQHVKIVEQVKIHETLPNPQPIYSKHSGGTIDVIGSHKERDTGVPHPIQSPTAPRMIVPGMPGMPSMPTMPGMIPPMMPGMFPPPGQLPTGYSHSFPPGLAPPGLAPPHEIRPEIKREDGTFKIPPSSMPMNMAGPLPPPRGMFPMPTHGMVRPPMLPNMLPPPGAAMVPPMLLPPPLFSDSGSESGSAGEEKRRGGEQRGERRRSHSREKRSRRTHHKERTSDRRDHSRSSAAPRRERDRKDRDKTRRSSRGDDSSRHRSSRRDEEGRTKRSRRKKDSKSGGEEEEGEGKEVETVRD